MNLENCKKAVNLATQLSDAKYNIDLIKKNTAYKFFVYDGPQWKDGRFIITIEPSIILKLLEDQIVKIKNELYSMGVLI